MRAAATIHDTYELHTMSRCRARSIFSKMKRFFGVDVAEPGDMTGKRRRLPRKDRGSEGTGFMNAEAEMS